VPSRPRRGAVHGQGDLGDGTTTQRLAPVAVSGLTGAREIAAGSSHTCALTAAGTATAWGAELNGQLGGGATRSVPGPLVALPAPARQLGQPASGHTCAIARNGDASCWGTNLHGQLGDNSTAATATPVSVLVASLLQKQTLLEPLHRLSQLALGGKHTCAVIVEGALRCWGANEFGQLGIGTSGTSQDKLTATIVPSFTLNVAPRVLAAPARRRATVTIIATCERPRTMAVAVRLTQRRTVATGSGRFRCAGRTSRYRVHVKVRGHRAVQLGRAVVRARALIKAGRTPVENQSWTRKVRVSRR
jgi:hypothetical protein